MLLPCFPKKSIILSLKKKRQIFKYLHMIFKVFYNLIEACTSIPSFTCIFLHLPTTLFPCKVSSLWLHQIICHYSLKRMCIFTYFIICSFFPLYPYPKMSQSTGISSAKAFQVPSDRIHCSTLCPPFISGLYIKKILHLG